MITPGGARPLRHGGGREHGLDPVTAERDPRTEFRGVPDAPSGVGAGDPECIGEDVGRVDATERARNMIGHKFIHKPVGGGGNPAHECLDLA